MGNSLTSGTVESLQEFIDSIKDIVDLVEDYSRSFYYESLECRGESSFYDSQVYFLIPAIIISICYTFTIRRTVKGLNTLDGRPGVVYPMNIFTSSERLAYAACFGVLSNLVFKVIVDEKQAIDYTGPLYGEPFVTVLSCLMYGVICFPLFASVSLRSEVSYTVGSVYTWVFTTVTVWSWFNCDLTNNAKITYLLMNGCQLVSLAYLSVRLPRGAVLTFLHWRATADCRKRKVTNSIDKIRQSYQGIHVRLLSTKIKRTDDGKEGDCIKKAEYLARKIWKNWVYEWQADFRYPARFLSIMWIGFSVLYMAMFKTVWTFYNHFRYASDFSEHILDTIGWEDQPGDTDTRKVTRILMIASYYFLLACLILGILSLFVAFIIGLLAILYSLTAYRRNMRALQRGDHTIIVARTHKSLSNVGIVTGSIRYAGYQVAYIGWAFFVQAAFIFVLFIFLIILVVVLLLGLSSLHMTILQFIGPWLAILIVVMVTQYLAVKFVFLEDSEESLSIDNRRCLFVLSYFLFFYNLFIGIGSFVLRLIKGLFIGICLLSRLDQSLLNRQREMSDKGYQRYVGFLHLENYHNHPVQQVMVQLLQIGALTTKQHFCGQTLILRRRRSKKVGAITQEKSDQPVLEMTAPGKAADEPVGADDVESGGKSHVTRAVPADWSTIRISPEMRQFRIRQKARFSWALIYTLHNNPQIRVMRKGYLQQRLNTVNQGGIVVTVAEREDTELDKNFNFQD